MSEVTLLSKRSAWVGFISPVALFFLISGLLAIGQEKPSKFKASTELVQVSVSALDREGRVATGLTKKDFELFEDGVKQNILECMTETSPVSLALVLDKSRSMRTNLPLVVKGAENVLDEHLKADDEFLVVLFDNTPALLFPEFISNTDVVKHQISSHLVEANGLTSLFDAVYLAVSNVKQKANNVRRAVIVITDGGDTHSRYTKKEIRQYLEEADVPLFAVNASEPNIFQTWTVGKNGKPELLTEDGPISPAERGGPKVLMELAGAAGGTVFTAHEPADIPRIMGAVYDLISNQYTLSYKPNSAGRSSRFDDHHKVEVKFAASGNRFEGYHLTYKHQYNRPDIKLAEKTMTP
jgi:Ca-activated chloride channel family protein